MDFGKINVQVANRVVFEFLLLGWLRSRQAANAVALEKAVQGRAAERGDGFLQRLEAVVERQERVLAKGHGNGLLLGREHR